jgi:phosphoribosylamine--glycine ligase
VRVLLVGSGGREHALARALVASAHVTQVHAAPGNPGIARLGRCHPIRAEDADGLVELCRDARIDLAVVGPEAPLVAGIADALRHAGVAVFGPSAEAARIEGSKSFAKEVMEAAGVPTAATLDEPRAPCVIKADGLAAGKGVFVCRTQREADEALPKAETFGGAVVIEELLEGEEASVFAIANGESAVALPAARDAKRLRDGDEGPNTGGMGAFSPIAELGDAQVAAVLDTVHRPVLAELSRRGAPFVGCLYAGLMLTADGPKVLEFNCRFGDPETQVVIPRLDSDLAELCWATATGSVEALRLQTGAAAAVVVVVASEGYPERTVAGVEIRGIEEAEAEGALVFQAGTATRNGRLVSAGGRVLNVVGVGATTAAARDVAYRGVARLDFPGMHYRRDIALRAVHVAA